MSPAGRNCVILSVELLSMLSQPEGGSSGIDPVIYAERPSGCACVAALNRFACSVNRVALCGELARAVQGCCMWEMIRGGSQGCASR